MSTREALVVDMDDVLVDYKSGCAAYFADRFGHVVPVLTMRDYFSMEYLGTDDEHEADRRMRGVFADGYAAHLLPKPGALDGIQELAEDIDLFVGTARGDEDRAVTEKMIQTYYPGIFKDVMLGNHYSTAGPRLTKVAMCEKVGALGIVDDNYHARVVAMSGRLGFLFGDYSWNRGVQAHHSLFHVDSLRDVHTLLRQLGAIGRAAR